MKSFLDHLKEEVLPSVQVADGGLDIDKPAVRAAINAAIAGVVSQPAVTPYVVFNRLSKLLAQYHIILPRKFLEGDRGVEVFEIRQYGHRMGMTDSGEFVNEVPSTHYLFMQYGIISPFGITYAKPVVGGMFRVMARLVDKAELDKLLDMAEITMAEEAECMQAIHKANAPKEEMKDITSDEKKKGNKAAVATSEKGLDEANKLNKEKKRNIEASTGASYKKMGFDGRGSKGRHPENKRHDDIGLGRKVMKLGEELSHGARELTLHADNDSQLHRSSHQPIIKNLQRKHAKGAYDHDKATKLWGYHANRAAKSYEKQHGGKFSVADRKAAASHFADSARDEHGFGSVKEDKDPCWKGYEMIGMKKKGGKPVPNCVPVKEEEQIDELSNSTLASYLYSASDSLRNLDKKEKTVKNMKKIDMRDHGMHTATNKIIRRDKKLRKALGEEQIDEVSKRLLGRYIKKAHVSGLGAAAEGEQAYSRKDKESLHKSNKTGEKREQGIERAVNKMTGSARVQAKEEYEKVEAGVKKRPGETHTLHRRNPGHKTEYHTITTDRDGRKSVKTGSPKYIKKHWDKLEEDNLDEVMGSVKKSYAMKKMKKKVSTQVKQGLGVGKERTNTVLVTNKGDPKAAGGGGVHRIPRDKYDPTKHNLASE